MFINWIKLFNCDGQEECTEPTLIKGDKNKIQMKIII